MADISVDVSFILGKKIIPRRQMNVYFYFSADSHSLGGREREMEIRSLCLSLQIVAFLCPHGCSGEEGREKVEREKG